MAIIYTRKALFVDKAPLFCSGTVDGFELDGMQPADTDRRVIFAVDGEDGTKKYVKLSIASGIATETELTVSTTKSRGTTEETAVTDADVTADYVLSVGNTVTELGTVTSIPTWAGKKVYPIIALIAPEDSASVPTLRLGIKTTSSIDVYKKMVETGEYDFSGWKIKGVKCTLITKDGGKAEVSAIIRTGDAWSKELSLDELNGLSGDAIKFKVNLSVTTIGTSQAGVEKLILTLTPINTATNPFGNTAVVSKTQAFDIGMTYGRLYVKHGELRDAKISADIMFRETPKKREMYKIAEGTGKQQTVTLADTQVDFSTLQLFANNDRIPVFDFNSMENTVTFTAPDLSTVFATYEYEVEPEVWQPMQAQGTQSYTNTAGYASTSFAYQVTGTEKGYSAVRVNLEKPEGSVQDALLGIGTGRMQTFFLPHYAKVETLKLKNGTEEIARKNWNYDQESKMLRLIALKDREVTASYEYVAESPKVYGFVAAWNQ